MTEAYRVMGHVGWVEIVAVKKTKENKNAKYAKEVEELRKVQSLGKAISNDSAENILLSASGASTSETVSETTIDRLLHRIGGETAHEAKDIELTESLVIKGKGKSIEKHRKVQVRRGKKGVKVRTQVHVVKKGAMGKKHRKR